MNATALKLRLRADLKAAMQARATAEVRVLRELIAAIDNAEAVPGEGVQDHWNPRALGDSRGEVARREIAGLELAAILAQEIQARLAAADQYEQRARHAEAERLREDAALVARYRAS